jgi:hypothetical protein
MTDLVLHIVERVGRVNGEAYQNDVRLRVCQWPEPLVVLLTRRVPESQLY